MPSLVYLIGARGTGKSTVGRALAARLGWNFLDADERLETAGVYLLKSRLRETIPANHPLSMEMDVIPRWLADCRRIHVHSCRAPFIDTPESLDAAAAFLTEHGIVEAA